MRDVKKWLRSVRMLSVQEIDIQPEFTAQLVEKELFEALWNAAGRARSDRG